MLGWISLDLPELLASIGTDRLGESHYLRQLSSKHLNLCSGPLDVSQKLVRNLRDRFSERARSEKNSTDYLM